MVRIWKLIASRAWVWSFLASIVIWLIVSISHAQSAGQTLSSALNFAVFSVIVGIGQMLVFTLGPGNIDLSIPSVITLGAVIAMKVMNHMASNIPLGIALAMLAGIAVGLVNYGLIWLLRIPAIVPTLASNLVVLSVAISYERGLRIAAPEAFFNLTVARVFGIPIIAMVTMVFSLVVAIVLSRTTYGRQITAIGQNTKAATLVGIKVHRVKLITYVICALLAALAGSLLAGFVGGTSLDLGEDYSMGSIAVVILGGTSVNGGKSNVQGIWGAAMFLYLLSAMLNTFHISEGLRMALSGMVIVAVILLGGGEKQD
jgi:ribose transport system permease protein